MKNPVTTALQENMTEDRSRLTHHPMLSEDSKQKLAISLGMEVLSDLSRSPPSDELISKVPYAFVKKHLVLPIEIQGEKCIVAVSDPIHLEPIEDLKHMLECEIETVYTQKDALLVAISSCYDRENTTASQLIEASKRQETDEGEVPIYDLLDLSKERSPIVKILNLILREAISQGASDIHFEPTERGLRIRYRIDGVLQKRHAPDAEFQAELLSRIKVMAKMDIAEHRLPQDGRIKLRMGNREIDFRVSTVPIVHGERIVLRILDKGTLLLDIEKVGIPDKIQKELLRLISLPEGIILVTGPTGSGKTTTLYSCISKLAKEDTNIMTIEDPVEYNLKNIAQIGVRPKIKLDFAKGLRHILRQDPDVIMIGEIRDVETAEIAIQASLTGHLVISTLHTNDAPSAITRLVDMGIEPYLLSSTIVGVMSQRLVRRICPSCKISYTPDAEELRNLGLHQVEKLYKGRGCNACFKSGYRGRQGLYELMPVGNAIKRQIVKSPDSVAMRQIALESGMSSLLEHGAKLVAAGVTTVSEVLRVTRGVQED